MKPSALRPSALHILTTLYKTGDFLNPTGLQTESLENPLGLDERCPRLSWQLESAGRDKHQSAYQILVASLPDLLESGQADLWDSGEVPSSEQNQIVYSGVVLESRQTCYWTVRVWDEASEVSNWSLPAHWEMGLLEPSDWQAGRLPGLVWNSGP